MRKRILIFIILIFLLTSSVPAGIEVRAPGLPENFTPPVYQPLRSPKSNPFKVGERLVYSIQWMGIEAGTGILEVGDRTDYQGIPTYHFVSRARTSPNFSKFYPVEDRLDSFAAVEGLRSHLYVRHLREGFYKHDSTTTVDHQIGKAYYQDKTYKTKSGVKDDLCGLYYFRTLKDLEPGKTVVIEVFAYKKTWEIVANILGRERVVTPAGAFDTLKIEPLIKHRGIFKNLGRVFLWVTDDARRLPVMVQSKIIIGEITASLQEYRLE